MSNGVITLSADIAPNSVAMLKCDSGYRPQSYLNRTCLFGGQWSEGNLECVMDDTIPTGTVGQYIFSSFVTMNIYVQERSVAQSVLLL